MSCPIFQKYKPRIFCFNLLTLNQAREMIKERIDFKINQIKKRKLQLEAGKFETITELIEVEIRNLQKDIEFLKAIDMELSS